MSVVDQWIADGQVTMTSGVASHVDPDVLPPDANSWARNVTTSSGKPQSRWRFKEMGVLPGGVFNGCGYFSKAGGQIVGMTNGQLWVVDFSTGRFRLRHIPLNRRNNIFKQAFFCETAESMVVQNTSGTPIIFSGNRARKATRDEVPRGGPMAYGNGRLWVARGNVVFPGDIVQYNKFQSELSFTEIDFFAGGGAYRMPGEVTGLAFIPLSDSATGFGSLLVFGRDWTAAIRAEIFDRQQWSNTPGFVSTVFPHIGCMGQDTITTVNQDVYWRSGDGELRSFRQAVLDYQTPGATPISANIGRLFDHESDALVARSSTVYFRNRLLGTTSAFMDKDVVLFRDLFTLDFLPQASMGQKGQPVFEGEWDGHRFVKLVTGKFSGRSRLFGVVYTEDDNYRLVEVLPEAGYDEYTDLGVIKQSTPVAEIEYRKFDFQNRFQFKKIMACDVYLGELTNDTDVKVYFRPDNSVPWEFWDSFHISIAQNDPFGDGGLKAIQDEDGRDILDDDSQVIYAETVNSGIPPTILPQYRVRLRTRSPEDRQSENTNRYSQFGYTFQIKLEITAPTWKIDRVQIAALPVDDSPFAMQANVPQDTVISTLEPGEIDEYRVPTGELSLYEASDGQPYTNHKGVAYHVAG